MPKVLASISPSWFVMPLKLINQASEQSIKEFTEKLSSESFFDLLISAYKTWLEKKRAELVFSIFLVIFTTFQPLPSPAFFRCLSNSGIFTELRSTSFIESTGVACSDSVSHNRVQVLIIPILLLASNLRRQSSSGCRFNPDYRLVIIQKYLTLVPGYG